MLGDLPSGIATTLCLKLAPLHNPSIRNPKVRLWRIAEVALYRREVSFRSEIGSKTRCEVSLGAQLTRRQLRARPAPHAEPIKRCLRRMLRRLPRGLVGLLYIGVVDCFLRRFPLTQQRALSAALVRSLRARPKPGPHRALPVRAAPLQKTPPIFASGRLPKKCSLTNLALPHAKFRRSPNPATTICRSQNDRASCP
jgi:hypothetical protein